MLEVSGKYNSAKIFTDVVDQASIAQVILLCSQEFTQGSRIRMMPDIHAGAGCTVGTTMTITQRVVPNLVGVDIGCGMETVRLREKHLQPQQLDKLIYQKIPSGFAIREKPHRYMEELDLTALCCYAAIDPCGRKKAWAPWGAATISSRWTGTRREIFTLSSTPAAGTWGWRWPTTTKTRPTSA